MDVRVENLLREVVASQGRIVALTGAGVSAESGIPTFRGSEGYWTSGSESYHPQEMATWAMFERRPELVWPWYLHRRAVCAAAEPNGAHEALARLDGALGDRFLLVTQNVDGLHLRAGSSAERTYHIHGNLNEMRCAADCCPDRWPLPALAPTAEGGLPEGAEAALRCPHCGSWCRPHVLWFDECYDEERYRFESTLRAVRRAALLIVVGTSGATTLPVMMGQEAAAAGAAIIDVNPSPNPFSELAATAPRGAALRGTAVEWLPPISSVLSGA